MSFRHEYIIGDLQGCYGAFIQLLDEIKFDHKKDKIWLAGDLVARGEDSLGCLRHVKYLHAKGCLETVLGNHDINLIAVWRGISHLKRRDNTANIFSAKDCDDLLNWLRNQPLMLKPNKNTVLVHAGIPPNWSIKEAEKHAKEIESALQLPLKRLDKLLPTLYSKVADDWSSNLKGDHRLRAITNYFTRMRLCDKNGLLEFDFKSSLNHDMPKGFKPWFEWKVARKERVFFGHWAGLEAKIDTSQARATDAGCVWGGKLLAYRLGDGKIFTVDG